MADRTYELAELEAEKTFFMRLFRLYDVGRECCIPAIVEEYDRGAHTATVRPLVRHWKREGGEIEEFERAPVTVGVMQFAHGGFVVDAPVFRGDTGWLFAGDRGASAAMSANSTYLYAPEPEDAEEMEKKNKGAQSPDNADGARFVHGFFVPCSWAATGLSDGDGLVIRHARGIGSNRKWKNAEFGVRDVRIADSGISVSVKPMDGEPEGIDLSVTEEEASIERASDVDVSGEATVKDKVRLCAEGLKFDGVVDREQQVVADVRYDVDSHQLQKKTVTLKVRGDFVVGVSTESGWQTIDGGQAVPEQTS